MANVTWEKRENTFSKLVNTMGLCFTSCKLVQNSFFWGEEFYLKCLSLPTLFISLRFGCVSCNQFSRWIEKEKKDLIQWDHWIYSSSNLILYPMIQAFRWIIYLFIYFYLIWSCIFMFLFFYFLCFMFFIFCFCFWRRET